MSVTVTLQVFSGRENPTWPLSADQIATLRQKLDALRSSSFQKPPGIVGGLGYQGFSLEAEREMDLEPHLYVHDDVVDLGPTNPSLHSHDGDMERWLLSTAGRALEEPVRQYVDAALPRPLIGRRTAQVRPEALEVPRFEPNAWNNDPNVRLHNNCYNYASNKVTNTFAQPGRGSGAPFATLSGTDVGRAIVSDGVEARASPDAPMQTPIDGHYIALVIWPGMDFHFYRLDDTTQWSHKPGSTAARDFDASSQPITDPRACDRGPYTEFVGYFQTFPNRITIR